MKRILLTLSAWLLLVTIGSALVPASASAASSCGKSSTAKGQVLVGLDQVGNCDDSGVEGTIKAVVTILSYVAGLAAVIMVILSGLKYTTSGGDANKVSSAKSSLIYALVGIAIAALAQVMVHYVINTANDSTTPCPSDSTISKSDPACK